MPERQKKLNTQQVAIDKKTFSIVLNHALKYYGHIGKFYSLAAEEKMKRDIKKMEILDTGND